jgi:hypothetical protein
VTRLGTVVLLAIAALCAPAGAGAQATSLTTSGFTVTFPTAGGAEFAQGWVAASATTSFTVNATSSTGGWTTRNTLVCVKSATGTTFAGKLQWRRSDLTAWNSLATTNTAVETRNMTINGTNDPWTQTVYWRAVLGWTTDAPASTGSAQVVFTLVQAAGTGAVTCP